MARAKKAEGEKRPTAYSKKFKEKVVTPEEAKEIMERPIVESVEKSKEDLRKAFEVEKVDEIIEEEKSLKEAVPEMVVPEVHSRSSMYDAEVVGQLIVAAKKSMAEHGIVNVIELSRAYYIPIDDVRGILEEIGMM